MVTRVHSFVLPLLLLLIVGPAQADEVVDVKDTVKRSFKVVSGGTLYIDIDHGNVDVTAHRGNEIFIEVERIARTNDRSTAEDIFNRHDLTLEEQGGDVYIESRYDDNDSFWRRMRSSDRLKVTVRALLTPDSNLQWSSAAEHRVAGP